MCTASWLRAGEAFHLFFNRDELRSRARAAPPLAVTSGDGTRWLAPVDGAAHGTWIAATSNGLLLALLNRTEEGAVPRSGAMSRGAIIPALAGAASLAEAEARLRERDLGATAPFRLFGRDATGAPPLCWGWNGVEVDRVELDPDAGLLCSSGLGDARVTAARTPLWERMRAGGLSPEALARFHRSHEPSRSGDSVCMHRDDARTVSSSAVRLDRGGAVEFLYVDGPPCEGGERAFAALTASPRA
jgi:hypothetical protein